MPLPGGFRVVLDPGTRQLTEDLLFGGSPGRVLRLTAAGRSAWRELLDGPLRSPAAGALARRLTDAGLAHPCPPPPAGAPDVTVVVPARDRAGLLACCLAATGRQYPVIVVDDGSDDPEAVAAVARAHRATLLRRDVNGGPGAARNTALPAVDSELVAFVDSDCVPDAGWVERMAGHFADPLVGAAAPRVVPIGTDCGARPRATAANALDLGEQAGRVAPGARVSYVPAAALLARRAALLSVACGGEVFDPALRIGEDVDLVWRLDAAGWRIRYDPAVQVHHHEPATWTGLLARRLRYGTSAAPLAARHPEAVSPLVVHPWPAVVVAALLARRPVAGAAAFGSWGLIMNRTLRRAGVPASGLTRAMLTGTGQTWLGLGRYGTRFGWPLLALVIAAPGTASNGRQGRGLPGGRAAARRWGRRLAAASLLAGPPLTAWARQRPQRGQEPGQEPGQERGQGRGQNWGWRRKKGPGPLRFTLGEIASEVAYGCGVLAGCAVHRTSRPLRPVIVWRPLRTVTHETRDEVRHGR